MPHNSGERMKVSNCSFISLCIKEAEIKTIMDMESAERERKSEISIASIEKKRISFLRFSVCKIFVCPFMLILMTASYRANNNRFNGLGTTLTAAETK